MKYTSENMNYIFNVSYFDDMDWSAFENGGRENHTNTGNTDRLKPYNDAIRDFSFKIPSPVQKWQSLQMKGYKDFQLYTKYPGLMIGTGNEHSLKMDGAIKCGFSFDYVTGLPYIPGSSLKGALRACFPGDGKKSEISLEYEEYIRTLLGKDDVDIDKLKENIFDNNDVFLGAFPDIGFAGKRLLDMEFITPHTAGKFKNPNPISQIKVRPDVKFDFCFILSDYCSEDGTIIVSAEEKKSLFEALILDMGMGAKTHVGFGLFSGKRPKQSQNIDIRQQNQTNNRYGQQRRGQNQYNRGRR